MDKNYENAILKITDIFAITGKGCVVAGEQQQGVFRPGDKVIISREGVTILETEIAGIEMFVRYLDIQLRDTQSPSLLLKGITENEVMKNDYVIGVK